MMIHHLHFHRWRRHFHSQYLNGWTPSAGPSFKQNVVFLRTFWWSLSLLTSSNGHCLCIWRCLKLFFHIVSCNDPYVFLPIVVDILWYVYKIVCCVSWIFMISKLSAEFWIVILIECKCKFSLIHVCVLKHVTIMHKKECLNLFANIWSNVVIFIYKASAGVSLTLFFRQTNFYLCT